MTREQREELARLCEAIKPRIAAWPELDELVKAVPTLLDRAQAAERKLEAAEKEIERLKAMANRWINEDLAEMRDCGDK